MLLAIRRCKNTSLNPIEWLDTVDDEELRYWRAYDRIEPMGGEWDRAALIARMIDKLRILVGATHGMEIPFDDQSSFMPQRWIEPPSIKPQDQSPEQIEATIKRLIGGDKYPGVRQPKDKR